MQQNILSDSASRSNFLALKHEKRLNSNSNLFHGTKVSVNQKKPLIPPRPEESSELAHTNLGTGLKAEV